MTDNKEEHSDSEMIAWMMGWILVVVGVYGMFGPWAALTAFGLILMVSCVF